MIEQNKSGLSFQTRVTAAAMITAVGVLTIACALFTLVQWGAGRANLVQTQKQTASILAPRLADAMKNGDRARAIRILRNAAISPRFLDAELFDDHTQIVARYPEGPAPFLLHGLLESRTALVADGRPIGLLVLQNRFEPAGSFLPRYLALTGALFFAAMALSLFIGRMLAKRVIEPVGRLSRVMGEVAVSGDLLRRVERSEGGEIGELIESFNALLDRLHENDVALHETMQALVAARDDAEAATVQKSQFLANMSHEIRTPLNGVLAMAQVMAVGELNDQQRSRLEVIHGSGEALLTVLNDILDVSKIEAGMLELETVEFDLGALACATVNGFAAVAESKRLALELTVSRNAQGSRMGDPARFRQIMSNLISNAVKFTEVGSIHVAIDGMGPHGVNGLRLTVTDTGIGIAEGQLPLLFQKFTQLDASATRRFGGTGLGLSICRDLTEKMGGEIWAESESGAGTTFFVELPLPKGAGLVENPVVEVETASSDEDAPLRILAAEDNPTNQVVLSTILEIFGAELQLVDNGQAAVDAWAAGDHDVILMDIQMPIMDGIAATREIRKAEAASGRAPTPIIALSANAMAHQVEECLAAGMDGHVSKPIELNKLHAALETAVALRQAQKRRAA